jgi:hypothetical protein
MVGRYVCARDRGDVAFFYRQYERRWTVGAKRYPSFTEVEYETLIADREAEPEGWSHSRETGPVCPDR